MESTNWQTTLSTPKERFEYVFKNSLFCDVEFSVVDESGIKVTIPANKFMLATASPVFAAMFYGHLAEKTSTIDLPDCSKQSIYEMLRYVHCEEVRLTENNIIEVLYVAEKYMMPYLVEKCKEYIDKYLKPEHVFTVLPLIKEMRDDETEKRCWEIIDCETLAAVNSKSFLQLSSDTLCEILSRDQLTIKEVDLFLAVDRWVSRRIAEKELEGCGKTKRDVLGEDAIRLIRFPLMSHKEFAQFVLPTEVLTMKEVIEIAQVMSSVETATCMFSSKGRATRKQKTDIRFSSINAPGNGSWWYDGNRVDVLDFVVSQSVCLAGVELFGSKGSSYAIRLDLYDGSELISSVQSTSETQKENLNVQGIEYYGFDVYFDRPVRLSQECRYTAKATVKGPLSYFGSSGKSQIHHDDGLFIKFIDNTMNGHTSMNRGQFGRFIILKRF
ncbi:BTB/POZ domain-containing protein 6-B-like [Exaiptasia diaphana]|uniref:BTB domain-containing protein n=1 Tax=Exaiptasia diaphana TaxID=2652724 RepID=A0A913XTP0_EXADI|nr:BTB/POZ domain-containing protein 6-B-like [Exaiptasia diaphana]